MAVLVDANVFCFLLFKLNLWKLCSEREIVRDVKVSMSSKRREDREGKEGKEK